jgi:hypothetical protein
MVELSGRSSSPLSIVVLALALAILGFLEVTAESTRPGSARQVAPGIDDVGVHAPLGGR